jgi:hypothetical protein
MYAQPSGQAKVPAAAKGKANKITAQTKDWTTSRDVDVSGDMSFTSRLPL